MSVNAGSAKVKQASKKLLTQWSETKLYWRDANSRQFEDRCLKPLLAGLKTAEKAMSHMDDILNKVRRDCT